MYYKLLLNFKAFRQRDKMKQKHRTLVMQRLVSRFNKKNPLTLHQLKRK